MRMYGSGLRPVWGEDGVSGMGADGGAAQGKADGRREGKEWDEEMDEGEGG